jgi:hypothetical protein
LLQYLSSGRHAHPNGMHKEITCTNATTTTFFPCVPQYGSFRGPRKLPWIDSLEWLVGDAETCMFAKMIWLRSPLCIVAFHEEKGDAAGRFVKKGHGNCSYR